VIEIYPYPLALLGSPTITPPSETPVDTARHRIGVSTVATRVTQGWGRLTLGHKMMAYRLHSHLPFARTHFRISIAIPLGDRARMRGQYLGQAAVCVCERPPYPALFSVRKAAGVCV
jgi:hypothetical protein